MRVPCDWQLLRRRLRFGIFLLFAAGLGCGGKNKPERLHEEGVLLWKHGKYPKAIDRLEEALKLEPERPGTKLVLADAYLKSNKPETAMKFANEVLAKQPESDQASLILGQSLLAISQMQTTRTQEGTRVANPKLLTQAADIASKLRKKDPNSVEGMLLQAEVDAQNQQPKLAEQLYRAVQREHPDEQRAAVGLARSLAAQRKFDESEAALQEQIKKEDGPHPELVRMLATVQLMGGKGEAAWNTLQPGLNPKEPELANYLLAGRIMLARLGAADNATTDSVEATGATTATTTTSASLGTKPAKSAMVKQLAELGSAMKGFWPNRAESYYLRGLSYELQSDHDQAVSHFQEAIRRDAASPEYRMALSGAHLQRKEFELAREDLRNLLKIVPPDSPFYLGARLRGAQTYVMEGKQAEGITALKGLTIEFPENKQVKAMLGQVLTSAGSPEEVQEGLQILEDIAGKAGLKPGGREYVLGQSAMREAREKSAAGDYRASTIKYQEAEMLLNVALQNQPDNAMLASQLAQLAELRGDLVNALALANRAAKVNPRFKVQEARLYSRLNQVETALSEYGSYLKANPGNRALQLEYAGLQAKAGQLPDAIKTYDEIIAKNPNEERAITGKAQILANTQGIPASIDYLKRIVEKNESFLDPAITLAHLLIQQTKWDEAEPLLKRITQQLDQKVADMRSKGTDTKELNALRGRVAPFYLELAIVRLLNNKPVEAAQAARDARRVWEQAKDESSIIEAVAALSHERAEEAVEQINSLEGKDGKLSSYLPMLKSLALMQMGDVEEAKKIVKNQPDLNTTSLQLFERLLERSPEALKRATPRLAREIYLAQRPLYAEAELKLAEESLRDLPDEPFVLARRGEALQLLGRADEALAAYEALAQAMPRYAPVRLAQFDLKMNQAQAATRRGDAEVAKKRTAEAENFGRAAIKLDPKSPMALTKLGTALQEAGKIDEANSLYRQVLQIDPTSAVAANNLAWNLADKGKLDEAAKVAEAAVKAAPRNGGILDTQGWVEFQRGNYGPATEMLGRASRIEPSNPEIRFHWAQALEKSGKKEAAVATLETMLLAWPRYVKAGEVRSMLTRLDPNSPALKLPAAGQSGAEPSGEPTKKS